VSLFFLFVQFEFTHALGPHAARYIVDAHLAAIRPQHWTQGARRTQQKAAG